MKVFFTLALAIATASLCYSQNQLEHPKNAFLDTAGRYFQQAEEPVYLYISTSPDGERLELKSNKPKGVYLEGHGVHVLKHANSITNDIDKFMIHADGLAPKTSSSFVNAPTYSSSKGRFYGKGLSVTLMAKDEMSGLGQVYHSVNGSAYTEYAEYDFTEEGEYSYKYYAVDKTGNVEVAQDKKFIVDTTPPESFHNIVGISSEGIVSVNSSIYLTAGDSVSGLAQTYYKFDNEEYRLYKGGAIPFKYLSDDHHTLSYYSIDNVKNQEEEKSVEFYLDKSAPIMSADVLGDKFIVGNRVYFSGRTKLKLTAVDNKSGVKDLMYAINSDSFITYDGPFYLPNRSGIHNVKFYAIDSTDNKVNGNFEHSVGVIYVDLTGPTISHSFEGVTFDKGDTVYISPETKVVLTASDKESGVQKITYSLNDEAGELDYESPISIEKVGLNKLSFNGYDNVNNKNMLDAYFIVDAQGPTITSQHAITPNAEGKYPSYTTIFLAAIDTEVGVDYVEYQIDEGKMQRYIAPVQGFKKNGKYSIKIIAHDLLGNTSEAVIEFETDTF
ncbi:hypothetical protein R9C00_24905 [Flammeovirgaceae bacterium SG7u.111]|nr:hypothetical protein [Flammeovirgaceae bacterium SG7u.132]WPO34938.1 hypothetical protein R9C00_24905 [Flammeovirgaceae bacterium SG7u.111]